MKQLLFLCVLLLGAANQSFAQFEKIIHQSFEIEEIIDLKFNIKGDVLVEPWAGNVILTETKVRLHDASPSIFKYYLEKERYNLTSTTNASTVKIESIDLERKPIRTRNGECYEFVKTKIFVPENYIMITDNHWRMEDAEEAAAVATKDNETGQ